MSGPCGLAGIVLALWVGCWVAQAEPWSWARLAVGIALVGLVSLATGVADSLLGFRLWRRKPPAGDATAGRG